MLLSSADCLHVNQNQKQEICRSLFGATSAGTDLQFIAKLSLTLHKVSRAPYHAGLLYYEANEEM